MIQQQPDNNGQLLTSQGEIQMTREQQGSGEMPSLSMNSVSTQSNMQPKEINGGGTSSGLQSILVEIKVPKSQGMAAMQLVQDHS